MKRVAIPEKIKNPPVSVTEIINTLEPNAESSFRLYKVMRTYDLNNPDRTRFCIKVMHINSDNHTLSDHK